MAEIITGQFRLFLISMVYGAILGVWYDLFRALRRKITHRNRIVHLEDVIYCISSVVGLFVLFQVYNQGQIRFFVLIGLEVGALLYFFLCSSFVERGMAFFIGVLAGLLKFVFFWFLYPGKLIVKYTVKSLKNMKRTVRIIKSRK